MSSWWVLHLCFQDSGRMRRHKWSVEHKVKTPHSLWFTLHRVPLWIPIVTNLIKAKLWKLSHSIYLSDTSSASTVFVPVAASSQFSHSSMCALLPHSPCLVWLHGTPPLDCLSPSPDRPKAQIPACYSNTTQPVEGKHCCSAKSHRVFIKIIHLFRLGTAWS